MRSSERNISDEVRPMRPGEKKIFEKFSLSLKTRNQLAQLKEIGIILVYDTSITRQVTITRIA